MCIPVLSPVKPNDDQPGPLHLTFFTLVVKKKKKNKKNTRSQALPIHSTASSSTSKHWSLWQILGYVRDYTQISIRNGWKCMLVVLLAHARDWLYFAYTFFYSFLFHVCVCVCLLPYFYSLCKQFSWIYIRNSIHIILLPLWSMSHPAHSLSHTRNIAHKIHYNHPFETFFVRCRFARIYNHVEGNFAARHRKIKKKIKIEFMLTFGVGECERVNMSK